MTLAPAARLSFRCQWLLALALVIGSTSAIGVPHVLLSSGKKIEGTAIQSNEKGEIILTTAQGQMTFPKDTKFFVDEPPEYKRVLESAKIGQHDEAIRLIRALLKTHANLGWDLKARRLLPGSYLAKKDFLNAVKAYEELFGLQPQARNDQELSLGYLQALTGAGARDKLAAALDPVIAKGPRSAAAYAQVVRGNLRVTTGDHENALLDFMRTADFFADIAETAPEALYRTGESLEKLGDKRAIEYFNRLRKEHPTSPFASQAASRGAAGRPAK